jgi:hypothetical protein
MDDEEPPLPPPPMCFMAKHSKASDSDSSGLLVVMMNSHHLLLKVFLMNILPWLRNKRVSSKHLMRLMRNLSYHMMSCLWSTMTLANNMMLW